MAANTPSAPTALYTPGGKKRGRKPRAVAAAWDASDTSTAGGGAATPVKADPARAPPSADAEPKKKPSAPGGKLKLVRDRPLLARGIKAFLFENSTIDASAPIDEAYAAIEGSVKLNDVFLIPILNRLLNMDGALRFALFLQAATAPKSAEARQEPPFKGATKFSAATALGAIIGHFDLGVQSAVFDLLEEDESGSGSASGSDDYASDAEASKPVGGGDARVAPSATASSAFLTLAAPLP